MVDFIHSRIHGNPSRNIKGMLEMDINTLLTPDNIFDHFQERIKETLDINPYYVIGVKKQSNYVSPVR